MSAQDLDQLHTALSEALGRVGKDKALLLLATLSLELMSRQADAQAVLPLIAQAERLSLS